MTASHKSSDPSHPARHDNMYDERVQDPYRSRMKWPEPTKCPDCGAIFHGGRWTWGDAPEGAQAHRCPACSRIHDRVPAGILVMGGDFLEAHRDEIMNLVRNQELKEKGEHPLERIMAVDDGDGGDTVVTFTGVHLTRAVGEALNRAYEGDLDIQFADSDAVMRVTWRR